MHDIVKDGEMAIKNKDYTAAKAYFNDALRLFKTGCKEDIGGTVCR
jgi:hypothetical protein